MSDTRLFTDNKRTGYIMSKLYNVLNRENVILHMTLWGLVSGALLGVLYLSLALFLHQGVSVHSLDMLIRGTIALVILGSVFGGGAGLLMGFANGLLMYFVKKNRQLVHSQKKYFSYGVNLMMVLAVLILSFPTSGNLDWFRLFGAPGIIATGASLLATERHFNLLLTQPDARKPKAKRDAATA
jgi:hypothetical protein